MINIIWCVKTQNEVDFSFDWINEIFSLSMITHHYDLSNKFDKFINNSIIVVSVTKDKNLDLINYINHYNSNNLNYTILHLSDEDFTQNIDFYNVYNKIIRNYYKKEYTDNYNLLTIPLGYKTGIKKLEVEKTLNVNFIGQIKSDRHEMLNHFNKIDNKFIYLTNMWNDPNGLDINKYGSILNKSYYTLCPRGWVSLDSFRINEALECNSIPISILDNDGDDYFKYVYGNHPFIIGKNWKHAFDLLSEINIDDKSNEVKNWWINFKKDLKLKLNNFIK